MKYSGIFKSLLGCSNPAEVFDYLMRTLTDSITYWDYFVNWEKVRRNVANLEMDLNTLNYLVGKEDMEAAFKELLSSHPSIIRLIPILLACRDCDFTILTGYTAGALQYAKFNFGSRRTLTQSAIEEAYRFCNETGLLRMFQEKAIKSVPDYVLGIEVGLDSNGRKNRAGTSMETIVGALIRELCIKNEITYIPQASSQMVRQQWGIELDVDKSDRRFDFAVLVERNLYLIETNYYGGGGSKLKATAGEYRSLFDFIIEQGHKFIWITDGLGWKKARKPLRETFDHIDYILNLKMVMSGTLEQILMTKL